MARAIATSPSLLPLFRLLEFVFTETNFSLFSLCGAARLEPHTSELGKVIRKGYPRARLC